MFRVYCFIFWTPPTLVGKVVAFHDALADDGVTIRYPMVVRLGCGVPVYGCVGLRCMVVSSVSVLSVGWVALRYWRAHSSSQSASSWRA